MDLEGRPAFHPGEVVRPVAPDDHVVRHAGLADLPRRAFAALPRPGDRRRLPSRAVPPGQLGDQQGRGGQRDADAPPRLPAHRERVPGHGTPPRPSVVRRVPMLCRGSPPVPHRDAVTSDPSAAGIPELVLRGGAARPPSAGRRGVPGRAGRAAAHPARRDRGGSCRRAAPPDCGDRPHRGAGARKRPRGDAPPRRGRPSRRSPPPSTPCGCDEQRSRQTSVRPVKVR